jgi:hypothetical protein
MKKIILILVFLIFIAGCAAPNEQAYLDPEIAPSGEAPVVEYSVYEGDQIRHNAFEVDLPLSKENAVKVAKAACKIQGLVIAEETACCIYDCESHWELEVKAEGHCKKHIVKVCTDKAKVLCEHFVEDVECEQAKMPVCPEETKVCPDGTVLQVQSDCKFEECPELPKVLTEFSVSDEDTEKKIIVNISFPLSEQEALEVAVASCSISEETPAEGMYENVMDECFNAWEFKDDTNPCDRLRVDVCVDKTFVRCIHSYYTEGFECIEGVVLVQKEYMENFIVANPLNLSEILEFSRFRGCYGHDWSGQNDQKVYAPFNGTVTKYYGEQDGGDYALEMRGDHAGKWIFMFGHVFIEPGLEIGSRVMAGELVGRAPITSYYDGTEFALMQDISTEPGEGLFMKAAPLDYMSDEVLAEYAARGVTPENMVFTKEERDADPCNFASTPEPADTWVSLN